MVMSYTDHAKKGRVWGFVCGKLVHKYSSDPSTSPNPPSEARSLRILQIAFDSSFVEEDEKDPQGSYLWVLKSIKQKYLNMLQQSETIVKVRQSGDWIKVMPVLCC